MSHVLARFVSRCPRSLLRWSAPLLAAAIALPAVAQEPPPDPFGEVIEVRVVNLEVVVTDSDGNRITGLGPEDFRLTVDGKQVPIDYFSEIVGGEVRESSGAAAPGVPAAGGRVGTNYLVFVDDFFAIARDRNQVLESLADDLSFLGVGDRMAVVAFDGQQVEMLSTWSDSPRQLRRALEDARGRKAHGLQRLAELRGHDGTRTGIATASPSDVFRGLDPESRMYADRVRQQVERSVSAAVAALRGFAQPEGRKVMLLLTGGWPFSPAAFSADSAFVPPSEYTFDGPQIFRPLADTANLLGYTLYPVDVPGLAPSTAAAADREPGSDPGSILNGGVSETTSFTGAPSQFHRENTTQDTLYYLAHQTGGRALVNSGRLDALGAVTDDTRSYYWLGFTPQRQRDDRRHDVRIEVTRPGLRVRTRDSFKDLSRQAEREMAVESALLFGEPAVEGALQVQLGEPRPSGRRLMTVPITVGIPLDRMTVLPDPGGESWKVGFELRVAAVDERGDRSEVAAVPVELTLKRQPPAGSMVPFQTQLELRRARQSVVISLTDPVGGASLSTRLDVAP